VGRGESTVGVQAAAEVVSRPGSTPVRVWPHHFDIASLLVLDPGDRSGAACLTLDASDVRGAGVRRFLGVAIESARELLWNPTSSTDSSGGGPSEATGLSCTCRYVRMTM
jgi:hypothetical protein